ncbi:hypothetical protein ABK040_006680 [Willaertia magna]
MPNLYHQLAGMTKASTPPIEKKKYSSHQTSTILTKSNAFMFMDVPKTIEINEDDEDSDDEIYETQTSTTEPKKSVMFDLNSSSNTLNTNTLFDRERYIQKVKQYNRPINDMPKALLKQPKQTEEDLIPEYIMPSYLSGNYSKRKLEGEIISNTNTYLMDNRLSEREQTKKKRKQPTPDIYQPKKSFLQSLFSL